MINECEAVGGIINGRGNGSTGRKPAHVLLLPPKIPHELACDGIGAAAMDSQASN
jgi:hypothetical protein